MHRHFSFKETGYLTYLYRMHAIRLLCAGKLFLVSSCKTTQVVLDAPQVEKRIYVINSAPHFPLLVVHRMHHLMHLPIPPVFRVIPAVTLKKFGQPRGRLTESCIPTNHQKPPEQVGPNFRYYSSSIVFGKRRKCRYSQFL